MADNIHNVGDFNNHMEKSTDPLQKAFGAIIDSVGFVQHVDHHFITFVIAAINLLETPTKDHQKSCNKFSDKDS